MAPKKAELTQNPPVASSSEEDEESGSSGEESESSAGDSKKNESKLESDSEGDSESDSEPEPAKKNKQSVVASGSDVIIPESSSGKRPLKQTESEAKRLKISEKPETDEKAKKVSGMFQRLFSETDEIAMLEGLLDFASTKGNPSEESDAFCVHLKKLIDFNATKVQIVTKLQRLKKKYLKTVKNALKKGKSEDEIVFAKDLDQKAFDLSRKIWGANGVVTTKSRKKLGGTPMKDIKLKPHASTMSQEEAIQQTKFVDTCLFNDDKAIASFFNVEGASACGLDESTIIAGWKNVSEGAKKKEMEEKSKKLKAKQVELCLQRSALVNEVAKMIFKANAS